MNKINYNPDLTVHNELDSDHNPVTFTLFGTNIANPTTTIPITNWDKYKSAISQECISNPPLQNCKEVDKAVNYLTELLREVKTDSTTFKERKPSEYYLSDALRSKISQKNALRKRAQITRFPADINRYNRAKREIKTLMQQNRIEQWEQKVQSLSTEDNSVWRMTRALKSEHHKIGPIHGERGMEYSEKGIAEALADSLEKQFMPNTEPMNDDFVDQTNILVNRFFLRKNTENPRYTNPSEIRSIIKNLKTKKAAGEDLITNKMIKEMPIKAILLLSNICNAALRLNHFPTSWKNAIVINFLKQGKNPVFAVSYRPISLLSCLSKVFERIILKRFKEHMTNNGILNNNQFGFREKHSTVHQIVRIVEKIIERKNNREHAVACFLDIEKAFDRVWIVGLIRKMIAHGFPSGLIKLIWNYLSNRRFRVRINKVLSSYRIIQAGVPQGSVLAPDLFIFYINDFPSIDSVLTALYADDTAMIAFSKNIAVAFQKLQLAVTQAQNWCETWRVKINTAKSAVVHFKHNRRRQPNHHPINMFGSNIPELKAVKYLGVYLDQELNFNEHISRTLDKANAAKALLFSLIYKGSKLSLQLKRMLYLTMIRTIFMYAAPAWGCCSAANRSKLQIFQNKILRMITAAPWYVRNVQLHKDLEIPEVNNFILETSHNFFQNMDNSTYDTLKSIGHYDYTVIQKHKRCRTIFHDDGW